MTQTITVSMNLDPSDHENPYMPVLCGALAEHAVRCTTPFRLNPLWLLRHRALVDVLHFQWREDLAYRHPSPLLSGVRFVGFIGALFFARLIGYRIVWTIHEGIPSIRHPLPCLETISRAILLTLADALIVHSVAVARQIRRRPHTSRPIEIIRLGSYARAHRCSMDRDAARRALGILDGEFVFACFGAFGANKDILGLIEAFSRLRLRLTGIRQTRLIVAGRVQTPAMQERIEHAAAEVEGTDLRLRGLRDAEIGALCRATDVLVFPFSAADVSSSVLVGAAFGKPMIVSDVTDVEEYLTPDQVISYPAGDSRALAEAMAVAMLNGHTRPKSDPARTGTISWAEHARLTRGVYDSVLPDVPSRRPPHV